MVDPASGAGRLPFIDVHEVQVGAPAPRAFDAVADVLRGGSGPVGPALARALGCSCSARDFPREIPGFRIKRLEPPHLIELAGRHRFARYALTFSIEDAGADRAVVRAVTRAEFPGVAGRAYRALVIGSRGHVLAVRSMLAAMRRRAERG